MKKEELERLVKEGMTDVQIANLFDCGRTKVQTCLKKFGIKRERAHPNLKEDYFKLIDTKDKAYWLGFLYADGYVTNGNKGSYSIVLDLGQKDLRLIERFCDHIGANKDKIKKRIHKKGYVSSKVTITSVKMVKNLEVYGCTNKKSFTIELPELGSEELDMSFMMGYYDGDGSQNSCSLCCGNYSFLKQIKDKYRLSFEVKRQTRVYELNLGAEFKRKMMKIYPDSLPRKKTLYKRDGGYKTNEIKLERKRKFEVSKLELENLLKQYSYSYIGKKFNVSDVAIKKRAKLLGITIKSKIVYKKKFEVSKVKLENLLKEHSYCHIGRLFGVSDNSIKKRAIKLGIKLIPRRIKKEM